MWVFYIISLPWTLGMVLFTLRYFSGAHVPRYVFFTVAYTWFCSLSIIVLVPADIWTTIIDRHNGRISFFWSWSYWSTFLLTWAVVPLIQGYEDAGDFTLIERLKTSVRINLIFYLFVGSTALFGLVFLISMHKWTGSWLGFAMACSNTFGIVTGAFLLGFGLSEFPKSLWRNADWNFRQKVLSHKVASTAVKLDDAHQKFSNVIVVAQATSNQMTKRDPLRCYMDVIDKMLVQMLKEDPSFKPQGGQLGENDMEYDTDEKSMATLRRQLRLAWELYYQSKSKYLRYVIEALELEDTIKSFELREAIGWKYVSTFRGSRAGSMGSLLDTSEFLWRCKLRNHLQRLLAIILAFMSFAIILAEATLLPSVDLSLFSILVKSAGNNEVLVQGYAFVPLLYMCICTYYSLFKIGMLTFNSLTARQTSSVNLLRICSMVARYAAPISYNFLNLIRLGNGSKTIFEKRMGNIDDAVPFFGRRFNRLYPLIMVVFTLLVASNFFNRVIDFFGSWKRFHIQNEEDNMHGFDPSGIIILQKERVWLEHGEKIGEHVIPLARNFGNISIDDVDSNTHRKHTQDVEMKIAVRGSGAKPTRDDVHRYSSNKEGQASVKDEAQQTFSDSGLSTKWQTMKLGFQNIKESIRARKLIPMRQEEDGEEEESRLVSQTLSPSQSLDDIFQRLKLPTTDHPTYSDSEEEKDQLS